MVALRPEIHIQWMYHFKLDNITLGTIVNGLVVEDLRLIKLSITAKLNAKIVETYRWLNKSPAPLLP